MSREAFYATLTEIEDYKQKQTFLLDPMNPIRQAMHDALWQAMREKHPNSTRPSNIEAISKEVLGPDRMAEVVSPYETNLNMQLKKLTGKIRQKEEELKTLANNLPVLKGEQHDPWRTLYTTTISEENNVTRARILAYNASLLATVHKVPERVFADGNKAFHAMVHVHSALDLDGSDSYKAFLARRFPRGKGRERDEALGDLARTYVEMREDLKTREGEFKEVANRLKSRIGELDEVWGAWGKVSWKTDKNGVRTLRVSQKTDKISDLEF